MALSLKRHQIQLVKREPVLIVFSLPEGEECGL